MRSFAFEDWSRWQQAGCTRLPAVAVHPGASLPASWETFARGSTVALLESAQSGRYTYLCDRPARLILGAIDHAEIWSAEGGQRLDVRAGDPLEVLPALLKERRTPALPDWPAMTGGLLGVFGYDLVQTWERLAPTALRDLPVPLYAFVETRELFVYDHAQRELGVVVWCDVAEPTEPLSAAFARAQALLAAAYARWSGADGASRGADVAPANVAPAADGPASLAPSFTPEAFQAAVRRAQDYIAAGHTYQVNLSRRTSRPTALAPAAIYNALRRVNPSPYMGLLAFPSFALVCGSPELLVRLVDGHVSSRPIAGTRPRGHASADDTRFSAELLASEKERAEHLMLVDLIRNDIGRVAAFGSVHVPEFMVLERYSHVMHIVSQVEGTLAAGKTWVDVLRAMFPGGTITGCPKVRTMEIIEELEPVGRGFYTGALGWISYGGEMEMNIVIRSMLVHAGVAHVQAGAGIVADSQPARELDEATRKAAALWVALERARNAAPAGDHS